LKVWGQRFKAELIDISKVVLAQLIYQLYHPITFKMTPEEHTFEVLSVGKFFLFDLVFFSKRFTNSELSQ